MYGVLPLIKTSSGEEVAGYPVAILNPPKTAVLRLPNTAELLSFFSSQRTVITDLGRGASRSEDMPSPTATKRLFSSIRIDKEGVEFDDAEMSKAVGLISRHRLISCTRDGQKYVVELATLFDSRNDDDFVIPTVHIVNIPFEKDAAEYRAGALIVTELGGNRQEQRFPIEAPVKLYDKIISTVTGYHKVDGIVDPVPPHHKRTVVNAVMSALQLLDQSLDPNL